ncbi:hypothetical protein KP509_25G002300 [Ceratopteris richardii]|uniref:Uncharacterized protein n=1 Tax=Ceratopteris richardii TaxID=49495 RepID=A0A8T2RNJ5_CERRI|nr:hypothetical protein KP509_25G002300 [Ceratopteris richardii]
MSNTHKCCQKQKLTRGLWSPDEDEKLRACIMKHGPGNWSSVPELAGIQRCGKSCRLRWINYLRPDLKRGSFSAAEEKRIIELHKFFGNKWSKIASHLPGRTDNEIKNLWNSCLKKRVEKKTALDNQPPNTTFNSQHLIRDRSLERSSQMTIGSSLYIPAWPIFPFSYIDVQAPSQNAEDIKPKSKGNDIQNFHVENVADESLVHKDDLMRENDLNYTICEKKINYDQLLNSDDTFNQEHNQFILDLPQPSHYNKLQSLGYVEQSMIVARHTELKKARDCEEEGLTQLIARSVHQPFYKPDHDIPSMFYPALVRRENIPEMADFINCNISEANSSESDTLNYSLCSPYRNNTAQGRYCLEEEEQNDLLSAEFGKYSSTLQLYEVEPIGQSPSITYSDEGSSILTSLTDSQDIGYWLEDFSTQDASCRFG